MQVLICFLIRNSLKGDFHMYNAFTEISMILVAMVLICLPLDGGMVFLAGHTAIQKTCKKPIFFSFGIDLEIVMWFLVGIEIFLVALYPTVDDLFYNTLLHPLAVLWYYLRMSSFLIYLLPGLLFGFVPVLVSLIIWIIERCSSTTKAAVRKKWWKILLLLALSVVRVGIFYIFSFVFSMPI